MIMFVFTGNVIAGPVQRTVIDQNTIIHVHTKLGYVTEIILPDSPELINMGKGDFKVDVRNNLIFIKPLVQKASTNIIVTMPNSKQYLFLVSEGTRNWDFQLRIGQPTFRYNLNTFKGMLAVIKSGKLPETYRYSTVKIIPLRGRNVVYSVKGNWVMEVAVKKALVIPYKNIVVYQVILSGLKPRVITAHSLLRPYSISEKDINIQNVKVFAVATPDTDNLMIVGTHRYFYVFTKSITVPKKLMFEFIINGKKYTSIVMVR